jgi:hypothetical protein
MPKLSTTSADTHNDFGVGEEWVSVFDKYTGNIVRIGAEDSDLAPMLKGLPNDQCQCPHLGYVIKGQLTVTYADGTEVYDTGDAFYMPPGHTPLATAGSEFMIFSPNEEYAVLDAHFAQKMAEMQQN